MEDTRYAYAVSYIRALEGKLLSPEALRGFLQADEEEALFRILRSTTYGGEKGVFEERLRQEKNETLSILKKLSLDSELKRLLCLRDDFHNMKVLLKAKHLKKEVDFLLVEGGNIDPSLLKSSLQEGRMRNLPRDFAEVFSKAESEFSKRAEASAIDSVLDREYVNLFYRISLEYGQSFFTAFIVCFSDLMNIKNFFRVRVLKKKSDFLERILLDNGKLEKAMFSYFLDERIEEFAGKVRFKDYSRVVSDATLFLREGSSLLRLEKLVDEYLLSFLESSRYVVFGPEPVFAYSLRKDNELKSIRTIVQGKMNGVPADLIRDRIPFL